MSMMNELINKMQINPSLQQKVKMHYINTPKRPNVLATY